MHIISCEAHNFGSYRHIKFDMSAKGLTLIHGANGAGKSTLCDIVPWVLFGRTAKNGSVDDVLSWNSADSTSGHIILQIHGASLRITRMRGKDKDLYYYIDDSLPKRGKDLNDTQKQINQFLGFDETLYLAGAYFHEFSQTAQFFTATPKIRRVMCEQLVDLELAKKLQATTSATKKTVQAECNVLVFNTEQLEQKLVYMQEQFNSETEKALSWSHKQEIKLDTLKCKYEVFEDSRSDRIEKEKTILANLVDSIQPKEKFNTTIARLKAKLAEMPKEICLRCGASKHTTSREEISTSIHLAEKRRIMNDSLVNQTNAAAYNIKSIEVEVNPYEQSLLDMSLQENTHSDAANRLTVIISQTKVKLAEMQADMQKFITKLNDHEILEAVLLSFRSVLIQNAIVLLQDTTNSLISEHFDGELSLSLQVETSDKLDISIMKDGNVCSFAQLSKGQRQLLKLCFSIAVMKTIARHHAINFGTIFLDEAMDGFGDVFKLKAHGLLEKLSLDYENVFVVDHSEALKAMFTNKIEVSLQNGVSLLHEQS